MLNEECDLGFTPDRRAIVNKKQKVKHYRSITQKLGNMSID